MSGSGVTRLSRPDANFRFKKRPNINKCDLQDANDLFLSLYKFGYLWNLYTTAWKITSSV